VLEQLFNKIKHDQRHYQIVELMRDYAPRRRFENVGMMFFDLNKQHIGDVLEKIHQLSHLKSYLSAEERAYKFIHTFISQKRDCSPSPFLWPEKWSIHPRKHSFHAPEEPVAAHYCCQFAFQPIIEPMSGNITSLEALIRDKDGGSPASFLHQFRRINAMKLILKLSRLLLPRRKPLISATIKYRLIFFRCRWSLFLMPSNFCYRK
jgi:hypothetical protein